jgi:hypothetical protein
LIWKCFRPLARDASVTGTGFGIAASESIVAIDGE